MSSGRRTTLSDPADLGLDRDELFANLDRDKRNELTRVIPLFVPAAREVEADPSASTATRRTARRVLQ